MRKIKLIMLIMIALMLLSLSPIVNATTVLDKGTNYVELEIDVSDFDTENLVAQPGGEYITFYNGEKEVYSITFEYYTGDGEDNSFAIGYLSESNPETISVVDGRIKVRLDVAREGDENQDKIRVIKIRNTQNGPISTDEDITINALANTIPNGGEPNKPEENVTDPTNVNPETTTSGDESIYIIKATETVPFEIHYESLPFNFCIDISKGSLEGTYSVELDENEKVVKFTFLHGLKDIGYVVEHNTANERYDEQIGATAINLVEQGIIEETSPLYIIRQKTNGTRDVDSNKEGAKLKNGFPVASSYIQLENTYVFVNKSYIYVSPDGQMRTPGEVFYEFVGIEEPTQEAGRLESMITRIIAAIGDAFLLFIKLFLGTDITIDRIIFNKYDPTVIDFEGERGLFAQVMPTLNPIYMAFRNIAAAIYILALLYIGVRMLMAIGGPGQSKYKQHITNWFVGLVLLFVAPMFFRYIPKVVNTIIGEMEGSVTTQYTYYNIDEQKLKNWGFTDEEIKKLLGTSGEDTRTVWVETLTGKRDTLAKERENDREDVLRERQELERIVGEAIDNWNMLLDVDTTTGASASTPTIVKNDAIDKIFNYYSSNPGEAATEAAAREIFNEYNLPDYIIKQVVKSFNDNNIPQKAAQYYSHGVTITELDEVIEALKYDLMGEMRYRAGKTGRFVYVVVWFICIYEMIMILCLYYKRVIVMIILVMAYPLVAMTYPFDKMGDGKSQSMVIWFKEFTVNIIVQVAHAVVYVVLVEAGKNLYIKNSNNWLFFILAVLFLFPAERLIRTIFGLQGNTINSLKANVGSTIAGVAMLRSVAVNTARSANQNIGITKAGRAVRDENRRKAQQAKTARDRKDTALQARADQKERLRRRKAAYRTMAMRYGSVGAFRKAGYTVADAAGKVRSGLYKAGNFGRRNLKSRYRKIQNSNVTKFAKGTWKVARGTAGIAYGTSKFVTNAGRGQGLGAAYANATMEGRLVGGFKTYNKAKKK